ncbi:MAG: hypothetical protein F6K39_29790 [Okeania sp. SIO3B3]|nr:hypothetical protein [Okeania sp. SIO3B3]
MFILTSVAYAVNPTTGRMEFHHQGYKSFPMAEYLTSFKISHGRLDMSAFRQFG